MSYKQRALRIQFTGAAAGAVDLIGHRAEAIIENAGGQLSASMLQLRVWGMAQKQMDAFGTGGLNALATRGDMVTVFAGDAGSRLRQVFEGTIFAAVADYGAAPEVSFNASAQSGFVHRVAPAAASSTQGSGDVVEMITAIASPLGYVVQASGVTARLADQYLSGSAMDQIYAIADAARIGIAIEGKTIALWQNGGARDGVTVDLSPATGMIGYPTFTPTGITCRAEYNPDLLIGRRVKVTSMVPRTSGTWYTQSVRHELSTMMPGGPWWSTIQLSDASLYAAAN